MPSQNKLDQYYMSLALRVAELSHGVRDREVFFDVLG